MQNIDLHFKDGKFRIMQITDIQEQARINPNTLRLMNAALDKAKPDFVVLTGDQVKGYALDLIGAGREKVEALIASICKPMTDRSIPFTATFGNHDDQCGVSNSEQFEIYKSLPGFVYDEGPGPGDEGTFCLSVDDKFLIYMFDTHSKDGFGGFGALHKNQVEWYKNTRDAYEEKTGAPVPSMAFQHIPTPEYFEVLKKSVPFDSKSVRAYGTHKNTWYTLDPFNSTLRDFLKETPATSVVNSGEIDAFLEKKEVRALFCGHDHNISLAADYKGMILGFTQSAGFSAYGPGLMRGARYIDIYPDGTFETNTLTYAELCGKPVEKKLTYSLYEMAPASVAGTITFLKEAGVLLGTAGTVFGAAKLYKYLKKK